MNNSCSWLDLPACEPPKPLSCECFRRVLVLVPHPDDEVLGCGGLLATLHDLGIPTRVVLVTDGSGAGGLPEGAAARRQQEFRAALAHLGDRLETVLWQLPDGCPGRLEDVAQRVAEEVKDYDASLLVAPWPLEMHSDHALIGRAALLAHQNHPLEQGVLFYEVWSPLPAQFVLDLSPKQWRRKAEALACHVTALACKDYQRAMSGLASYRGSLLGTQGEPKEAMAEAYHGHDIRTRTSNVRFRYALLQDGEQIATLFREVFKADVPSNWWAWKYGNAPHKGSVAIWEENIIAFYGALPRYALWQGERVAVCQQGDVMVRQDWRFATRFKGVFRALSEHFLFRQVGQGGPYVLSFGFPTERALRIGEHLGLYRRADQLMHWVAPIQPERGGGVGWAWHVEDARSVDIWDWVDQLRAPVDDHQYFVLQKTGLYWRTRFSRHPSLNYLILRIYRWGKLRVAAVLRITDRSIEIMDIATAGDVPWSQLMLACSKVARAEGRGFISAWGTESAIKGFPGAEVESVGFLALPGKNLDVPLSEKVFGKCWMLGGDTDFR
ncbi:MAG: PIG-L deacetylase family protein [Halothiobacillaceae bacterium]